MTDDNEEVYRITDNLKKELSKELNQSDLLLKKGALESDDFEADWNDAIEDIIFNLLDDEE